MAIEKVSTLTPYEEYATRLELAEKFQHIKLKETPGWQSPRTFVAFLIIPLHRIQNLLRGERPLRQVLVNSAEVLPEECSFKWDRLGEACGSRTVQFADSCGIH